MGVVLLLAQRLVGTRVVSIRAFGALAALVLAFFGYEANFVDVDHIQRFELIKFQWCCVHISALSRNMRPHFNEANILETYQPSARAHGHLFVVSDKFCFQICISPLQLQPDPPTPGVTFAASDGSNERIEHTDDEKARFNEARDKASRADARTKLSNAFFVCVG